MSPIFEGIRELFKREKALTTNASPVNLFAEARETPEEPDENGIFWNKVVVSRAASKVEDPNNRRFEMDDYLFGADQETLRKIALLFAKVSGIEMSPEELARLLKEQGAARIDSGNVNYFEMGGDQQHMIAHLRMANQAGDPTDREPSLYLLKRIAQIVPREKLLKSLNLTMPENLTEIPEENYLKYLDQAII